MLGYLYDNIGLVLACLSSGTTGFALFAPGGKSGKKINYKICTFCARWQKWQNDEL